MLFILNALLFTQLNVKYPLAFCLQCQRDNRQDLMLFSGSFISIIVISLSLPGHSTEMKVTYIRAM